MPKKKATQEIVEKSVHELAAHCEEVLAQFGDNSGLPFDKFRYQYLVLGRAHQIVQDTIEMGGYLIVMKEHLPHGEFMGSLESMEINPRAAQRLMQTALKMKDKKQLISAAKSKAKAFELLVLDDDSLEALEEGGTVSGITLDDIDRMSSQELRAKLREAKANAQAKDEVIADKNKKLDELAAAKKKIKKLPPDEESEAIRHEAALECYAAEALIRGQVRKAIQTVKDHADINKISVHTWVQGQINQIEDALTDVCEQLGIERTATGVEWESTSGSMFDEQET